MKKDYSEAQRLIAAAEVAIAVYPDAAVSEGSGTLIIKGKQRLKTIVEKGEDNLASPKEERSTRRGNSAGSSGDMLVWPGDGGRTRATLEGCMVVGVGEARRA